MLAFVSFLGSHRVRRVAIFIIKDEHIHAPEHALGYRHDLMKYGQMNDDGWVFIGSNLSLSELHINAIHDAIYDHISFRIV